MGNEPYRQYTGQNREAWNRMAAPRRSLVKPPEFFASGGCTLDDFELELIGAVQGKRVLHLQCASGNETLSWAGQGARVVGVDISDVAIEIARDQARATGLDAEFVAADVYDLPDYLLSGNFDLVYSSWGVICWLPDLRRWAEVVAACLKSGGTFLLAEHHPLWEISVLTDHGFTVTHSYFGRGTPLVGVGHSSKAPSGTPLHDDRVNFLWPVGDVVTALIQAGLTIRHLEERPAPELYVSATPHPRADSVRVASWLPAVYVVLADKG
jgi:SAM-dependent methyltransferase